MCKPSFRARSAAAFASRHRRIAGAGIAWGGATGLSSTLLSLRSDTRGLS